jgi:hypothetical protein
LVDTNRESFFGQAALDSGKDLVIGDIIDTINTNFVNSEEHETICCEAPKASLVAPQRSSEIESHKGSTRPISYPKEYLDAQIRAHSISETAYEVGRKTSEQDPSCDDSNGDASLSHDNWQLRVVIPQHVNGKWITYVKIKVFMNVSCFGGVDGNNYKLDKGESVLLPEKMQKCFGNGSLVC